MESVNINICAVKIYLLVLQN